MIDNILISLSFVFLGRNMYSNEINDLTFKSDRLLDIRKVSRAGRTRSQPSAAIIDSQGVEKRRKWGASIDPHGFDAGKKIKGKKRHLLVDTQGLLMQAIVHSAAVQDRDAVAIA